MLLTLSDLKMKVAIRFLTSGKVRWCPNLPLPRLFRESEARKTTYTSQGAEKWQPPAFTVTSVRCHIFDCRLAKGQETLFCALCPW